FRLHENLSCLGKPAEDQRCSDGNLAQERLSLLNFFQSNHRNVCPTRCAVDYFSLQERLEAECWLLSTQLIFPIDDLGHKMHQVPFLRHGDVFLYIHMPKDRADEH